MTYDQAKAAMRGKRKAIAARRLAADDWELADRGIRVIEWESGEICRPNLGRWVVTNS